MNLPLTNIIESISNNRPEAEKRAFYAVINTVAEGKDLSNTHWAFLGSELRALSVDIPKRLGLPKYIQAVINSVIAGMDRLADGEEWPEANEVAKAAYTASYTASRVAAEARADADRIGTYFKHEASVMEAADAFTYAMAAAYAARTAAYAAKAAAESDADKSAAYTSFATTNAASSAAFAINKFDYMVTIGFSYVKVSRSQRGRLLEIIENTKPRKGKIMANKRGHHRKTEQARNAARIREIIKNNPYAKPKDIIEATGLHPATVSKHLKALRERAQQGEESGK